MIGTAECRHVKLKCQVFFLEFRVWPTLAPRSGREVGWLGICFMMCPGLEPVRSRQVTGALANSEAERAVQLRPRFGQSRGVIAVRRALRHFLELLDHILAIGYHVFAHGQRGSSNIALFDPFQDCPMIPENACHFSLIERDLYADEGKWSPYKADHRH